MFKTPPELSQEGPHFPKFAVVRVQVSVLCSIPGFWEEIPHCLQGDGIIFFHHQVDFGKESIFTLFFSWKTETFVSLEQSISSMADKLIQQIKEEEGN